jgi:hypothetical protein
MSREKPKAGKRQPHDVHSAKSSIKAIADAKFEAQCPISPEASKGLHTAGGLKQEITEVIENANSHWLWSAENNRLKSPNLRPKSTANVWRSDLPQFSRQHKETPLI